MPRTVLVYFPGSNYTQKACEGAVKKILPAEAWRIICKPDKAVVPDVQ